MSRNDRVAIFPSRANHVLMTLRNVSANKGFSLLKRKRDALELKVRDLVQQRDELVQDYDKEFADAIFLIAKANFLNTDFKPTPVIGSDRADAYVYLNYSKTIGILVPTLDPVLNKPESVPFTGLSRGGTQVEIIREKFQELLRMSILLGSHNTAIKILSEALHSTNMRMNGLEFVVIPRIGNTIAYIRDELEEMEREEFYRLKRSQAKRRALKDKKEQEKEKPQAGMYVDVATSTGTFYEEDNEDKFEPKKKVSGIQTIISGHYPDSNEEISPNDSILSGLLSKESPFKMKVQKNPNVSDEKLPIRDPNVQFDDDDKTKWREFLDTQRPTSSPKQEVVEEPESVPIKPEPVPIKTEPVPIKPEPVSTQPEPIPIKTEPHESVELPNDALMFDSSVAPSQITLSTLSTYSQGSLGKALERGSKTEAIAQTDITGRLPRRSEMNMRPTGSSRNNPSETEENNQ